MNHVKIYCEEDPTHAVQYMGKLEKKRKSTVQEYS